MSDKEIVKQVKAAAVALNEALNTAAQAGIFVGLQASREHNNDYAVPLVSVMVGRFTKTNELS